MRNLFSTRCVFISASAIFLGIVAAAPAALHAQTVACEPPVVVSSPPPPLPVYEQPPVPGPDYIWTPGYWRWDTDEEDYYWVPGTWAEPPRPGLFWTPGYWGWMAGAYVFHRGYWGPHVGFYGGIDYGYGYTGQGFEGGRWRDGRFFYNRSVTNISNSRITNVYAQPVHVNEAGRRVSFNGGHNGTRARPTPEQKAIAKEQHFAPTSMQQRNVDLASKDKSLSIKANHGVPPVAATAHPGEFKGPAITHAGEMNKPGEKPGMTPNEKTRADGANPEAHGKPMAPEAGAHHLAPNPHAMTPAHPAMHPGMTGHPAGHPGMTGHRPAGHSEMTAHPAAHHAMPAHPAMAPHPMHPAGHPAMAPRPAGHPEMMHAPMAHPERAHPPASAGGGHPGPHRGPEKKPGEK